MVLTLFENGFHSHPNAPKSVGDWGSTPDPSIERERALDACQSDTPRGRDANSHLRPERQKLSVRHWSMVVYGYADQMETESTSVLDKMASHINGRRSGPRRARNWLSPETVARNPTCKHANNFTADFSGSRKPRSALLFKIHSFIKWKTKNLQLYAKCLFNLVLFNQLTTHRMWIANRYLSINIVFVFHRLNEIFIYLLCTSRENNNYNTISVYLYWIK